VQRHERLVTDDHTLDAFTLARVVVRGAVALNYFGNLWMCTVFIPLCLSLLDQSERVRVAAAGLKGWEEVESEAQC
jgi:hypothetical protein